MLLQADILRPQAIALLSTLGDNRSMDQVTVDRALALRLIGPDEVAHFASDDPVPNGADPPVFEPVDAVEQIATTIRSCASGVAAFDGVRRVVSTGSGRLIPPPPRASVNNARQARQRVTS